MICTLGDLLLDVIVRLDGPIAEDTDTYGSTLVAPGGQAANVAAWVASLGASARFIGKRARDPAGRVLATELAGRGVDVCGPEVGAGTGTVISIATADGRRTMLTDRGVAVKLRPDELDRSWFADCETLHVPAYSLVVPPLRDAALAAAALARRAGARISADASSTGAIHALGADAFRNVVDELAPAVVFANEDEAALLGEMRAPLVVLKLGARGCVVVENGNRTELPAAPTSVVDTTGAGDAFAAGFLVGGPTLALSAAARCVAQMGAMP